MSRSPTHSSLSTPTPASVGIGHRPLPIPPSTDSSHSIAFCTSNDSLNSIASTDSFASASSSFSLPSQSTTTFAQTPASTDSEQAHILSSNTSPSLNEPLASVSPTRRPLPTSSILLQQASPPTSPQSPSKSRRGESQAPSSQDSSRVESNAIQPRSCTPPSQESSVEDGEIESDYSEDVEVYISSIGLDDKISIGHLMATNAQGENQTSQSPSNDESPVLPSKAYDVPATPAQPGDSPKIPSAPRPSSIPLPSVSPSPSAAPSHPESTTDSDNRSVGSITLNCGAPQGLRREAAEFIHTPDVITLPPPQTVITLPAPSFLQSHSPTPSFYDPNPTNSISQSLVSARGTEQDKDKTPNVYINGLPPHFPEDQLLALAAPYGKVRSVRTFTRHVRESESGYGFVLFDDIDSAERCINSLRKYRNLHPTFSKQIHKIPGTHYAHSNTASSSVDGWEQGSPTDEYNGHQVDGNQNRDWDDDGESLSFKRKMESLHDRTSTNLYMEGLPLSIDEPTLAALVSPYKISSSRFFQTRLSSPPRIIAFVRLETRAGAEEIIERLHGRMVRGWNDTGSRISVRFADTAEQRELRRTERSAREGSVSPARLTIAQAALLNLHGQDFGIKPKSGPALQVPSSHMRRPQAHFPADPHALHYPTSEFSSNAHIGNTGFAVDYSLAPQRMHTPPLIGTQQPYARSAGSRTMDPTMAALLNSLRNGAVPFQANNPYAHDDFLAQHYPAIASNRNTRASMGKEVPPHLGDFSSNHQQGLDRRGYTATEEYILRAHANSNAERRKPPPLDLARKRRDTATNASIAMGLQGKRPHGAAFPSSTAHGQQYQQQKDAARVFSPIEPMDQLDEEEFHASAATRVGTVGRIQSGTVARQQNDAAHARLASHRDSGFGAQQTQPAQNELASQTSRQTSQAPSNRNQYQHPHAAHTRSSTLPHRSTASISSTNQAHQRHYQHSSMSIPNTNSMNSRTNINSMSPEGPSNNMNNGKMVAISDPSNMYHHDDDEADIGPTKNHHHHRHGHSQGHNRNHIHYTESKSKQGQGQYQHVRGAGIVYPAGAFGAEERSPSLLSPALTYASQTPSTLSPATPFFSSFGGVGEVEQQQQQQQNGGGVRAGARE